MLLHSKESEKTKLSSANQKRMHGRIWTGPNWSDGLTWVFTGPTAGA